ncbi:16S rRNA (guanine(966)-N(2))-methyltransferase RsmD [Psychromonas sp. B3M02]|uniref:16S rRNA (guanine(966)-N(2))-methyltransferase RsmD n=1 Tax=Psychromonas sp. B3M02 TaxID=2267226 RepID=UPI000DEBFBEC|nr:16S rRNA (guanine(966)-N(2))-methyltransferase RsmD [Psychromonas sp. B3M02]RBW43666.1 16S rRNA (guanine(966)-N(2))-methyltransferase RsmD [Psychromonas sp. B3M02]
MRKNQRASSQEKGKKPNSDGFIRLISGQWRGKKLPVKDKQGLRPTTDRTKETLFNWLMHDIRDANCLDCFSGSGSLGFEALSRYCQSCTFLELDKQVATQLKNNIGTLKAENAQVIQGDSLRYLTQTAEQQYDVVFVDPPFNLGLAQPCIDQLEAQGYLTDNSLIYVEVENTLTNLNFPHNWVLLKEKNAGQVRYQLFKREK